MKLFTPKKESKQMLSLCAILYALLLPSAKAANPADWKTFTSTATRSWSDTTSWTDETGIPTSDASLVINFDPVKSGTVTSIGSISVSFTSTNNLGTVQLNALNLAGYSTGSARIIKIAGGALQFSGAAPAISNSTDGVAGGVPYQVNSDILLDTDLILNQNGTSYMTLLGAVGNTLSANSTGVKTIKVLCGSDINLGGISSAVISDGSGQIAIVKEGPGWLIMGGANTFTGGILIKAGTVGINGSSAGTSTALGAGTVTLGDSSGSADTTLQVKNNVKWANDIIVQAGSAGTRTILNMGGSQSATLNGLVTVNDTLHILYTGGVGGGITVGSDYNAASLTGAGDIVFDSNASVGYGHILVCDNPAFTGDVTVNSGELIFKSDTALSAANTVKVASNGIFKLYDKNQTIGGLNNVSGSGGTVLNNGGHVKTLILGGNDTYSFSGSIGATTPANMALTVALTGNGTQTLGGTNTYEGATTVSSGILLVNGSLAAGSTVTVGSTGTMGGTGTVNGATTLNGTLTPGGSEIGTLTFANTLVFGENAVYEWGYQAGTGDVVSVTGDLQLPASATVNVTEGTGAHMNPGVLFAAGSLSGAGASSLAGWTVTPDGYSVAIEGASVLLLPPPDPRTMILVR